jgi:hypothetical protein
MISSRCHLPALLQQYQTTNMTTRIINAPMTATTTIGNLFPRTGASLSHFSSIVGSVQF